ncbi:MAG: hypothetical protein FIB07_13630 [Candidatus Methanoperedens sp.]|nr:hypothetical protein [Candidatus Methanoperedens sp.]
MREKENISERIEQLINKVNSNTQKELDDTIQNELGRLITLLPDIERATDSHLIGAIEVAVSALLLEKPNVQLATMIRKDVEQRVHPSVKSLFNKISGSVTDFVETSINLKESNRSRAKWQNCLQENKRENGLGKII